MTVCDQKRAYNQSQGLGILKYILVDINCFLSNELTELDKDLHTFTPVGKR